MSRYFRPNPGPGPGAGLWLFFLMLFTCAAAQAQPPETDNNDSIHMAVVGPMVGTSFSIGMQFRAGVRAAINTITQGTLLGRPIRITAHDDQCTRAIAESLSQDLVQNPPDVIIGHSCSATTRAAAPLYARHQILQITPSSTATGITEMGILTLFRMIGRDQLQGQMAADWLVRHHTDQRIGVFRFPGEYSMQLTQTAISALAEAGIEPAIIVQSSASAISYLDEIMQFLDADVDVVYMVGGALDSGVFVRQSHQVAAPYAIVSSDTLVAEVFMETAGEAAEGVPFTFPADVAVIIDQDLTSDAVAAIRAQGMAPEGYTLLAYAAAQVWVEGVRRAQSLQAADIAMAIRSAPLDTVLGPVSFDDKGDIHTQYAPFSWFVWQAGQRVPAR